MSLFEYISVAISIILALGVARLLTNMIELLRHRRNVKWHWVPLIWALAILIIQFQFWWQIYAVDGLLESLNRNWRNVDYIVMVLYTITLFTAGSLVLPSRVRASEITDLWEHFQTEGKLSLIALVAYVVCGILLNVVVLGMPLWSWPFAMMMALAFAWILPLLGTFFSHSRTAVGIWTGIFVAVGIFIWSMTIISQH